MFDVQETPIPSHLTTYQDYVGRVEELANVQILEPRQVLGDINMLISQFREKQKSMGDKDIETVFPDRFEKIFAPLNHLKEKCYDGIDPHTLTGNEISEYVGLIASNRVGQLFVHLEQEQNYCYVETFNFGKQEPEGQRLLKKVIGGGVVDENELSTILEYEKDIYKFHLNLPVKDRIIFLKRFYDKISSDRKKSSEIGAELQKKLNLDEKMDRDLMTLIPTIKVKSDWKNLLQGSDGNPAPDIVIYLPDTGDSQKCLKYLGQGIAEVCGDLEQQNSILARFSYPFVDNKGVAHTGLTVTQGDGDFKIYLQRMGLLDRYFDPKLNHSVMNS